MSTTHLDEHLLDLAHVLDAALADEWGVAPQLVRVVDFENDDDDGFELGFLPLDDGAGVIEMLAGFEAPAEWDVVGVMTEGNAFHTDGDGTRRLGAAGRVRVVHLVHRSGASASVMRRHGDEPAGTSCPPHGRLDDYCRRALTIATAPPRGTTLELWALYWLDSIISTQPDTWRGAASLHPGASQVLAAHGLPPGVDVERHVLEIGRSFARVTTWERLRTECSAGRAGIDVVSPEMAAWFDAGSFSRAVLEQWPPLTHVLSEMFDVVPMEVCFAVEDTLVGWELLPAGNT